MSDSPSQRVDLPEDVRDVLTRYVEQINQDWSGDLGGLILFGSAARGDFIMGRSNINLLLIVLNLSVETLQKAGKLHHQWGRHQIIAPLVMTEEELSRSRRFFPLEFLQMTHCHVLLAGHNPLGEEAIDADRLRWQCEQELMTNFLRIRQRFIEGEGRTEAIHALLLLSITAVLPVIRGILYSLNQPSKEKDKEILETLPVTLQFDPTIFLEILSIKRGLSSPGTFEWPKAFERYLHSLELFMKRIQEIRHGGR
mgnify:CR=1 FL=1